MTSELDRLIGALRLRLPDGVTSEAAHFIPSEWAWETNSDALCITGQWSNKWLLSVRDICKVLAYREGSLLRRLSERHYEFFTWRNEQGDGFKVVFLGQLSAT